MRRPAPMHLSEDERDHVEVFVRRGKANARTLTRARVLLKSDEGWSDAEIAEALRPLRADHSQYSAALSGRRRRGRADR